MARKRSKVVSKPAAVVVAPPEMEDDEEFDEWLDKGDSAKEEEDEKDTDNDDDDDEAADEKDTSGSDSDEANTGNPNMPEFFDSSENDEDDDDGDVLEYNDEESVTSDDDEHDSDAPDAEEYAKLQVEKKEFRDKMRTNRKVMSEKLCRTVFVGNLPVTITKKSLREIFKACGEIESVRLRGAVAPPPNKDKKATSKLNLTNSDQAPMSKTLKKVACIKGKFANTANALLAYVVFKDPNSVTEALKLNNTIVQEQHIRVDRAKTPKNAHQLSVFIGNLPYTVSEEQVREAFLSCGGINNVRLVRDRGTGLVKGFGFVEFCQKQSVAFALRMNGSTVMEGRRVRIKSCIKQEGGTNRATKRPSEGNQFSRSSHHFKNARLSNKAQEDEGTVKKNKQIPVPTNLKKTEVKQFKKLRTRKRLKRRDNKAKTSGNVLKLKSK